ncbi:MAG: phage protease [Gemmobacter sp.]
MTAALASAICDRALAPSAPEWVLLFNAGREEGRDGRVFVLDDADALVADFRARAVDLPVDFEHANDNPEAKLRGPVPAAGWVKDLRADDAGLWGRIEWTATAAEMIGRKEYRYISPSFLIERDTGRIVRLKGAGLVHAPNLFIPALASEEAAPMNAPQSADTDLLPRLVTSLGMDPAATADDVVAMVARMVEAMRKMVGRGVPEAATAAELARANAPDPARFIPVDAVAEMMRERQTERVVLAEGRAAEKVNAALRQGYITPAMRDWALALCRSDESSFDGFLAKTGPAFAHLFKTTHTAGPPPGLDRPNPAGDTPENAMCKQLGLPPGALDARGV